MHNCSYTAEFVLWFYWPLRNRCGKTETHLLLLLLQSPKAKTVLKCHLALSPKVFLYPIFLPAQVWRMSVLVMDLAQDVVCLQSRLESKPTDLWVFSWPLKGILNLTKDDLRKKWGVNRLLTHCQSCFITLCNRDSLCLPAGDEGHLGWEKVCRLMQRKV